MGRMAIFARGAGYRTDYRPDWMARAGLALGLVAFGVASGAGAARAQSEYVDFGRHQGKSAMDEATRDRVAVRGDGAVVLGSNPREDEDSSGMYNGGGYYYGTLTSPVHETSTRFDALVPSWNATTPAGTWVQVEARVREGGSWTRWFDLGAWASGTQAIEPHSVDGQSTVLWEVSTDVLQSKGRIFGDAYQYRLRLFTDRADSTPTVRSLSFVASDSYRHGESLIVPALRQAWGESLDVPARSQMIYPDGGEVWCSPTSLSMVMAYWADRTGNRSWDQTVPMIVDGTYDHTYRGWGNWPFNVGYAASLGFEGSVSRFAQVEQLERWTQTGLPVIASIAWNNDFSSQRLSGAALPVSYGHLLVVVGFTLEGDVVVNDPAGRDDSQVRRVYDRDEFARRAPRPRTPTPPAVGW